MISSPNNAFSPQSAGQDFAGGEVAKQTAVTYDSPFTGKLRPWSTMQFSLTGLLTSVVREIPGWSVFSRDVISYAYELNWDIPVALFLSLERIQVVSDDGFPTCNSILRVYLWEWNRNGTYFGDTFADTLLVGKFDARLFPQDLTYIYGFSPGQYSNLLDRMQNNSILPPSIGVPYMDVIGFADGAIWGGAALPGSKWNSALGNPVQTGYTPALVAPADSAIDFFGNREIFATLVNTNGNFRSFWDRPSASFSVPVYTPGKLDTPPWGTLFSDPINFAFAMSEHDWDVIFNGQLCRLVRGNNWASPMDIAQPL